MDLFEAVRGRRSVRAYDDREVPEDTIDQLLETAIQAPSAGNRQPWEFILVRDHERKEALAHAARDQEFVAKAPLVIVVAANRPRSAARYGARGADLYCIQDCAAATQNLMLAATELGLGTCWVGAFDEELVSRVVSLPKDVRPLTLIPVGYPSEEPDIPRRLPLAQVVHRERF